MQVITEERLVSNIVSENPLSSKVFYRYGIDFCCHGKIPLKDACEKKNLNTPTILSELNFMQREGSNEPKGYDESSASDIISFILKKYHEPFVEIVPMLNHLTDKVARVHGEHHPELIEVKKSWNLLTQDLSQHFFKEEKILFPLILSLAEGNAENLHCPVEGPITQMEYEHVEVSHILENLRTYTNKYVPPMDACNSYRSLYAHLQEIEFDLFKHIHIENNVLHPLANQLWESWQGKS